MMSPVKEEQNDKDTQGSGKQAAQQTEGVETGSK